MRFDIVLQTEEYIDLYCVDCTALRGKPDLDFSGFMNLPVAHFIHCHCSSWGQVMGCPDCLGVWSVASGIQRASCPNKSCASSRRILVVCPQIASLIRLVGRHAVLDHHGKLKEIHRPLINVDISI